MDNIYQHIDDIGMSIDIFSAHIPLNQPYCQHCLSPPAKEVRKGFVEGKNPNTERFYLMRTTDPTGRVYLMGITNQLRR